MHDPGTSQQDVAPERLMNVRKLAALDIVFHGPLFILLEFSLTVLISVALGAFILIRVSASGGQMPVWALPLGIYSLSLALNYLPLLLHAVDLVRRGSAQSEMASELAEQGRAARRYGTQQLLLLVPFAVFVLALIQAMRGRNEREAARPR